MHMQHATNTAAWVVACLRQDCKNCQIGFWRILKGMVTLLQFAASVPHPQGVLTLLPPSTQQLKDRPVLHWAIRLAAEVPARQAVYACMQ